MSSPAQTHQHTSRFPWLLIVFAVPALVVLLMLGNWQMQRLAWKTDLLATIDARVNSQPASLADVEAVLSEGGDIRYRPVTVTGTFAHDHEQHFFATHLGASGYYVYTPLDLEDGRMVLVNRGFVHFDLKKPETRPAGQIEGPVTIVGLARERLERRPSFIVPHNELAANIYYWKDWRAMVAQAGYDRANVVPFFIDANDVANEGGWPIGGVTRIDLPNNHLQYAITWFGLALTLVVIVVLFVIRRIRGQ